MPGGLLQLVATGAQTQLINGNPSFTFWRSMYKRHTNFAMESVRMDFENNTLQFPLNGGPSTFRCRVKRVTDLLHDCYFLFNLPDIWSPLYSSTGTPAASDPGYEFQWIENIGYNAIERITVLINGVKIYETTGEWFKLYSYLTHDRNKRDMIDQMVGNTPDLTDPGNAYGRMYQYPHAIQTSDATVAPEPSIRGRQIIVPLHLWFCENPGMALPLIALQNGEVEIDIRVRPVGELYTVYDVKNTSGGGRVGGSVATSTGFTYPISLFLSPPQLNGRPTNTALTNWLPDPYIEGNYIYLTEGERAQVAGADQSFLIRQVQMVQTEGQYGPTDLELPMHNLVTRIVWVTQRNDRQTANDFDNYTNWEDRRRRPIEDVGSTYSTPLLQLSSGALVPQSRAQKDILLESVLLLDAKERFKTKTAPYFSLIQNYKHTSGCVAQIPGLYTYSFALDSDLLQPSGALNASQFNRIILRSTLIQPIPQAIVNDANPATTTICVYRNTVFNPNPTPVPVGLAVSPLDTVTIIRRGVDSVVYTYTYTMRVYVESYNVMRVVSGLANLVFAS